MKLNTIIYNSANWDGIFCREIVRRALGGKLNNSCYAWEPGTTPLRFPSDGNVYVLGLPLDAPFGSDEPYDCEKNWSRLTWIHNDPDAIRNTDPHVPGLRIAKVACCRLAYAYFRRHQTLEECYPVVPTKSDFDERKVIEPGCLPLVEEVCLWHIPSRLAADFIAGMTATDGINWDLLLTPESAAAWKYALDIAQCDKPAPEPLLESQEGVLVRRNDESNRWEAIIPGHPEMVGSGITPRLACVHLGWRKAMHSIPISKEPHCCKRSTADLDRRDHQTLESTRNILDRADRQCPV
jgi:hypothetical protein